MHYLNSSEDLVPFRCRHSHVHPPVLYPPCLAVQYYAVPNRMASPIHSLHAAVGCDVPARVPTVSCCVVQGVTSPDSPPACPLFLAAQYKVSPALMSLDPCLAVDLWIELSEPVSHTLIAAAAQAQASLARATSICKVSRWMSQGTGAACLWHSSTSLMLLSCVES